MRLVRVRGTAAQALLDRGWGKAKVEVVSNAEGGYLELLRTVNERTPQRQLHTRWPRPILSQPLT